jgi:nucleotide-binding universal stress UspA family protein
MFKRILVPLDGSRRAERILPYVEEIAYAHESTVIVLQVVEPAIIVAGPYDTSLAYDHEAADRAVAEATGYVNCVVGELLEKGIAARHMVEPGPVASTILEVAAREHVDLVALASHGRTGLARAFYGSVTAGILHQADRPLLVIRSSDAA